MPNQISFTIAGLPVTLRWHSPNGGGKVPTAYAPFLSQDSGLIHLDLSNEEFPCSLGAVVFDSSPIWRLHRLNGGSLFRIFDSYPDLRRSLFVPSTGDSSRLAFLAGNRDPFVGPVIELLMIAQLARRRGAILHGCGIVVAGGGVVLAGESGAGKSTLSRLGVKRKGVEILSDDRVIVRRQNGALRLYGTPWHGEEAFAAPGGVPLKRIFFIRHGHRNAARMLSAAGTVREMLKCSFPPLWDAGGMAAALELFHDVADSVPCAELAFVPDHTAIEFVLKKTRLEAYSAEVATRAGSRSRK
jgi:hypothetical protein